MTIASCVHAQSVEDEPGNEERVCSQIAMNEQEPEPRKANGSRNKNGKAEDGKEDDRSKAGVKPDTENVTASSQDDASQPEAQDYSELGVSERIQLQLLAMMKSLLQARRIKEDNAVFKIEQGLFVGSVGAAHNASELHSQGVTHVLIAARSLTPAHPDDFTYMKLDVLDSPDTPIIRHFPRSIGFIRSAIAGGGGALVHCFAGRSRSVSIVAAYLLACHAVTVDEALARIRACRPEASPNEGFLRQLAAWHELLSKKRLQGVADIVQWLQGKEAREEVERWEGVGVGDWKGRS